MKSNANPMTRRSLLGQTLGAAALTAAAAPSPLAQAPAAQGAQSASPRIRESFDPDWKFFKGDAPGAQDPAFADASWRSLDVPHDWSVEGPYSEKELAQGSLPTGIGWYRKRFHLPESYKGRKVFIEFDGVFENSEVWINGQYLGKRPFGYIGFQYDLTPHLNLGARENVLAVKVDNSNQPNSRWYTGSGIYRHTWLNVTNPVHVAHWGTFVTTPQVSENSATVQIKTRVQNEGPAAAKCVLATALLDGDGKEIASAESSQDISARGEYEFVQTLKVDKPSLWSVETPYLYQVRSTLRDQNQVADVYAAPMGIREAVFDADKGFLLNGKRVKINGVCLHHDAGCVGAAVPLRMWERRLEILKAMGCNGIRTSHNPYAPEFMDLCDRMGFLVMDEAFDEWRVPKAKFGYARYFNEWWERDTTDFVRRDRNHPSVVLWSAGNEVGDQAAPNGAETLRQLIGVFHREDPTRLVTVGCDRIESEPLSNRARPEFLAALDVVGYNYVDRWRDRIEKYYSLDKAAFPNRKVIGTESGSMGGVRGSYGGLLPASAPAAAAVTAGRGTIGAAGAAPAPGRGGAPGGMMAGFGGRGGGRPNVNVEQLWKFVATYDYIAGDHMWTGIDYLGESRWPGKGASSGVIDSCGFPKDGFYFYQSQWTREPMVHLFPHWNWRGREGQFIPVFVYTNCDSVELFVNGKSAGVQGYQFPRYGMTERYGNYPPEARGLRTTSDLHLAWTIPYEPGTLRAVGRKGDKEIVAEVSTAGEPAAVELTVDRNSIVAGRGAVVHAAVRIVDAQGRLAPESANEVTFEVQGEGRLIGADNGNMQSHEDYKAPRRLAFNGMCLAVIQSSAKPGQIRITASSPGLKPSTVVVTART